MFALPPSDPDGVGAAQFAMMPEAPVREHGRYGVSDAIVALSPILRTNSLGLSVLHNIVS